jgi:hypothetical protein
VLVQPSYASKYPPAQGIMLAIGQLLTGRPIVGVWISTALFCAALTWMLLAWFPRRWALWGAALVILLLIGGGSQDGYWLSTYWGGMVAATGAALVYGAVRRIARTPTPAAAALFALGLSLLVLSRPFEGALVALPALVVAAYWLLRNRDTALNWKLRRVVAPFGAVALVLGTFTVLYNYSVTGHPLRLPYAEYEAQYSNVAIFLFGAPQVRAPTYSNDEMRRFYDRQVEVRTEKAQSLKALASTEVSRVAEIKRFLVPGLTLILLVAAITSRLRSALLLPAAGAALVLSGALAVTWFFPHYIAPVIAPWAILLTAGAERIATLEAPPGKTGLVITSLIFAMVGASALLTPFRLLADQPRKQSLWYAQRDSIAQTLHTSGRKHLVLVTYGRKHSTHNEWVHNAADLTSAPVIWARSLSAEKDARLLQYYQDRVPWKIHVDSAGPFQLRAITDRSNADLAQQ